MAQRPTRAQLTAPVHTAPPGIKLQQSLTTDQEQPMWPFTKAMKTLESQVGSDDSPKPLCPHCEEETATLVVHRSHLGGFSNMNVFSCPHCRKVLAVTATQK